MPATAWFRPRNLALTAEPGFIYLWIAFLVQAASCLCTGPHLRMWDVSTRKCVDHRAVCREQLPTRALPPCASWTRWTTQSMLRWERAIRLPWQRSKASAPCRCARGSACPIFGSRIGHCVLLRQPCIGSLFQLWWTCQGWSLPAVLWPRRVPGSLRREPCPPHSCCVSNGIADRSRETRLDRHGESLRREGGRSSSHASPCLSSQQLPALLSSTPPCFGSERCSVNQASIPCPEVRPRLSNQQSIPCPDVRPRLSNQRPI
jgi:hypothetical protein